MCDYDHTQRPCKVSIATLTVPFTRLSRSLADQLSVTFTSIQNLNFTTAATYLAFVRARIPSLPHKPPTLEDFLGYAYLLMRQLAEHPPMVET
jgi:hypothetical protein